MIRGLRFENQNSYNSYLDKLLHGIDIRKYVWEIDEDQVFTKEGFLFSEDSYTGDSFSELITQPSYLVFFINLQAYPIGIGYLDIETYDDFRKSSCEILIFVTDSIFVDIYAKDENIIETIKLNAERNNFTKIQYITDENDTRKEFRAM